MTIMIMMMMMIMIMMIMQQIFPKKTCSNLCMQKQDQFTIDELLYKNKISHGTLMIFLYFKRY